MKRTHGLLLTGVGAFAVTLVAQLPAAVAIAWLAPAEVRAGGVSGSAWNGHARELTVHGLRLTDTHWDLSVLELLRMRLGGDVETRFGEDTFSGNMVVRASGGMLCTACRFDGTTATLRRLMPGLKALDGRLSIDVTQLEFADGWPTRVLGVATLSDVTLRNLPIAAPGEARPSFKIEVSADPVPDNGLIEALIGDTGGPLECSARARLSPPGNFQLKGRMKARPGVPEQFATGISALGTRTADGSTELSLSGSF